MNTATLRNEARNAEAALNWAAAADLYAQAIAAYPRQSGRNSLAERDLANLEARRASCAAQAKAEADALGLTDLEAWEWPYELSAQPYDQHVRARLHHVEPRSREWEAEQNAAFEEAMRAEAEFEARCYA